MRVIVITSGSHGDVHPYIAVARALQGRGHEVRFLVHPHFHSTARAAGLHPVSLTPDIDVQAVLRDPDLMHRRRGGRVVMGMIFDAIPQAHETLNQQIDDFAPDAVLAHQICIGSRWLCERRGVPLAVGTLSPVLWFSRCTPIAPMQRRPGRLDRFRAQTTLRCLLPLVRWMSDRKVNALRESLGYSRESRCFEREFLGGDINLGLWSPALRGPQPDDPPHGHICGFPWYDGAVETPTLDSGAEMFLASGAPPIVFCLGTAASHSAGDFHHLAARAVSEIGRRAILLVGRGVAAPDDLPAGVMAVEYAPFSLLLPRALAVVHHGGIGSTAQTLRSGRPALVIPHAHDQFNNSLLTHALGVSRALPRHRVTVARLKRELSALIEDASYAQTAAKLGPGFASDDGAGVAAAHIEALVAGRRPGRATESARETAASLR